MEVSTSDWRSTLGLVTTILEKEGDHITVGPLVAVNDTTWLISYLSIRKKSQGINIMREKKRNLCHS